MATYNNHYEQTCCEAQMLSTATVLTILKKFEKLDIFKTNLCCEALCFLQLCKHCEAQMLSTALQ